MQSLAAPAAATTRFVSPGAKTPGPKQRPACACSATPLPRGPYSTPAVATAAASSSSSSPRQLVASQQRPRSRSSGRLTASAAGTAAAAAPRTSLDPMAASWNSESWESGRLLTITSPQQFEAVSAEHPDRLFVLMCKSHSCRPCKMFTRKYLSVATRFPECILAEIYGDETPDTRRMMMQMEVKVTPTFRMYRGGECVSVVTGTNDKKLMRGMLALLSPAELVHHAQEVADTLSIDEGDAAAAAADEQQQQPSAAGAPSSS